MSTTTATPATQPPLELDARRANGIAIRLLWNPATDEVFVRVHDAQSSARFDVPVPDHANALDVFAHPYAYAGR